MMADMMADLIDPNDPQGRSYRRINAAKSHRYPIGTLVELEDGVRLWVVSHDRDCDWSLQYCLSWDRDDTVLKDPRVFNRGWHHGIPEWAIRQIEPQAWDHLE